jgi:predicted NBD/HSP70 family sugar kinase
MINVSENPDGTGDKGLMLSVAALSRRAAVTLPQAEEVIAHLMDHLKTCPDCMVGEAIPDVVLGMRAAMKGGKP